MSLNDSMAVILERLEDWARYPKYALERRVDVLLTPFLADFVAEKLTLSRGDLELVAPEFPIRHGTTFHTINADFLLYRRDPAGWILLELKTDVSSVGDKQAENYDRLVAKKPTMVDLLAQVDRVRERSERAYRPKYRRVLRTVPGESGGQRKLDAKVEVVYLSPAPPTPNPGVHIPLDGLYRWQPPERHRDLWAALVRILKATEPDPVDVAAEEAARPQRRRR